MMEEKILTFECGNCGYPNIQIDVNIPYVGQRCPECKFVHMFKRQKEFECSTLILNVESEIAKEVGKIRHLCADCGEEITEEVENTNAHYCNEGVNKSIP